MRRPRIRTAPDRGCEHDGRTDPRYRLSRPRLAQFRFERFQQRKGHHVVGLYFGELPKLSDRRHCRRMEYEHRLWVFTVGGPFELDFDRPRGVCLHVEIDEVRDTTRNEVLRRWCTLSLGKLTYHVPDSRAKAQRRVSVDRALPRNLNGVGGRLHARLLLPARASVKSPLPFVAIQDVIIHDARPSSGVTSAIRLASILPLLQGRHRPPQPPNGH